MNDLLRALIVVAFRALALALELRLAWRVRAFAGEQRRLAGGYAIDADTPIRGWDEATQRRIDALAQELGSTARRASTSGSTRTPKVLLYTPARVRRTKLAFIDAFTRVFAQLRLRRWTLFVMAPIGDDASLTGMLLAEPGLPGVLACAQAPYRVQGHPSLRALAAAHGDAALRCVLLAAANPGVLYATNPSTLATFFDRVEQEWARVRELARVVLDPAALDEPARVALSRIVGEGAEARLSAIAGAERPLEPARWMPALEAWSSWDGGYLAPFVARVRKRLPAARFIPMYSMSTETLETVTGARADDLFFLPLAPGVLYEFLPEEAPDEPRLLLRAEQLEPGRCYTLVVSDAYGLARYQTEDVFRCERKIGELPDLRFVRRRALSYSFTGEKLTAEQLLAAYEELRARHPHLREAHLACMPSFAKGAAVPHYELLVVGGAAPDGLARELQATLCGANAELAAKISTGRLGDFAARSVGVEELVRRVAGEGAAKSWEAQFKFLPLYTRLWES